MKETTARETARNWALLLACCQEDATALGNLWTAEESPRHWQSLAAMAQQEGLAPLLYWRLRQAGLLNTIPLPVTESLRQKYYRTGAAAAVCTSQLHDLLPRCRKAGVMVIILKGAVLAELHYPNPALRPMSDIDILVKHHDLDDLALILAQAGYRTDTPLPDGQGTPPTAYLTTRLYRRQDGGGLPLHVHTHLLNSTVPNDYFLANFPLAPIWAAAKSVLIAGTEALILDPRHQVLHLAEHSLRVTHSLTRLQYLYDIDRTIRNSGHETDWQALCDEATAWGMASFLYHPLALASQWLKTPLPPSVLNRLRPMKAGLLERLFALLLAGNIRRPGLSYLLHLSRQPSGKAQLAFLARTAFPPRQVIARRNGISLDQVGARAYLRRVAEIAAALMTTLHRSANQLPEEGPS